MPDRSKARPRDSNQVGFRIVQEATGEVPKYDPQAGKPADPGKNRHAVALGRLCGFEGRRCTSTGTGPNKRSQIAAEAAVRRWEKKN